MNGCPREIEDWMHAALDGDLSPENEPKLRAHLQSCPSCREHMNELNSVAAMFTAAAPVAAPAGFAAAVMADLPKPRKATGLARILRAYPILTAAAVFLIMMSSALFANFSNDDQFSFTKRDGLIVQGETVIVPKGETVVGDLTVRNGNVRIDGKLDGDLTVINGQYMASSAGVTGKVEEVDKLFDWLWLKTKDSSEQLVRLLRP